MPAVQGTGPGTTGVSLFYSRDPEEKPSLATSFIADYLRTQTEYQRAKLKQRLALADPRWKLQLAEKLMDQRTRLSESADDLDGQMATAESRKAVGELEAFKGWLELQGQERSAEASVAVANIGRDAELTKAGALSPKARELLSNYQDAIDHAGRTTLGGNPRGGAREALIAAQELHKRAGLELQPLEAAEAERQASRGSPAGITDPVSRGQFDLIRDATFGNSPAPESKSYGVGRTPSVAEGLGEVRRAIGGSGAAPRVAEGGSSPAQPPPSPERPAAGTSTRTDTARPEAAPASTRSSSSSTSAARSSGADREVEGKAAIDDMLKRLNDPTPESIALSESLRRARGGKRQKTPQQDADRAIADADKALEVRQPAPAMTSRGQAEGAGVTDAPAEKKPEPSPEKKPAAAPASQPAARSSTPSTARPAAAGVPKGIELPSDEEKERAELEALRKKKAAEAPVVGVPKGLERAYTPDILGDVRRINDNMKARYDELHKDEKAPSSVNPGIFGSDDQADEEPAKTEAELEAEKKKRTYTVVRR